jgi:hypothetical protein
LARTEGVGGQGHGFSGGQRRREAVGRREDGREPFKKGEEHG